MSFRIQAFSIFLGILVFLFVFELVRRKKLKEGYSILWLLVGILMTIIPLWSKFLFVIAQFFQVSDSSSLIFLLGIIFLSIYVVHLSVTITSLEEDREKFSIDYAILQNKLHEIELALQEKKNSI